MRAIVVYESLWGNTEHVAQAIARGLESVAPVEVFSADAAPTQLEAYDLVVVGGPTHAFSMSRSSTRESAVLNKAAPRVIERGIREWLDDVSQVFHAVHAVTFDTKVESPRLPGSAAKAARSDLRSRGFDVSTPSQTFRVHGYEGPLVDGELERAAAWGAELAASFGSEERDS